MTFDHDFGYLFSFLKRKGEKNNQDRGQKSCLSARSGTFLLEPLIINSRGGSKIYTLKFIFTFLQWGDKRIKKLVYGWNMLKGHLIYKVQDFCMHKCTCTKLRMKG